MTFVKGATTWANLANDINKLLCGEMADDFGTTVASGDRWARETKYTVSDGVTNSTTTLTSATANFSTGVHQGLYVTGAGIPKGTTIASVTNSTTVVLSAAATATATGVALSIFTDTIHMNASYDFNSGACSQRTGYFLNTGGSTNSFTGGATNPTSVCRVTAPYTSGPGGLTRWAVRINVAGVNTVANNYSTATIQYSIYDLDTGTINASSTGLALNSAGVGVVTSGLSISVTDPSGFLQTGTNWYRAFTTTYMYGIDMWPSYYRASAAATFSVAPPGAAGTDYDVVTIPYGNSQGSMNNAFRGSLMTGLGIKTATGLGSGALYTLSFNMSLAKVRIFTSASTAGVLSLDWGNSTKDPLVTSTMRAIGLRKLDWVKMFQTPASVLASSPVQYWMSVKGNGIYLAVNGDPGASGKLCGAWLGAPNVYESTYDVSLVTIGQGPHDLTADNTSYTTHMQTPYYYWGLRRRQDNSEQAFRDWQTRWFRGESYQGLLAGESQLDTSGIGLMAGFFSLVALATDVAGTNVLTYMPPRQNKPAPDGKWWMYGFQFGEGVWYASSPTADESRFIRAYMGDRFLFLPEDGWGSGDELTDTTTGQKYLLLKPDYINGGLRARGGSNSYFGGVAIAEV